MNGLGRGGRGWSHFRGELGGGVREGSIAGNGRHIRTPGGVGMVAWFVLSCSLGDPTAETLMEYGIRVETKTATATATATATYIRGRRGEKT